MQLDDKLKKLEERLRELKTVCVAYSGGVDSTFLLKIAREVLKNKVLAVTAVSETYPVRELEVAKNLAKKIKIRHRIIKTRELDNPRFKRNPLNRCYYCKQELFFRLQQIAKKEGLSFVLDGSNFDDLSDYRPGARAKKEFKVISPLQECGLTKKDIRVLSRRFRLSTWKKPALACLASRIPYHAVITKERLLNIDRAEVFLRKKFKIKGNVRVRDYGPRACIEVDKKEIHKLNVFKKNVTLLKPFGYREAIIDPRGYRTGALNEEVVGK